MAAAALAGVVLTGCATGQRPYLAAPEPFPAGSVTGDAAVDAVLTLLDRAAASAPSAMPGTYEYSVVQRFGGNRHQAAVTTIDDERRIVIGDVTFVSSGTSWQTCPGAVPATCADGLRQQTISDTGATANFWAADTATRLRRKVVGATGPGVAATSTVAGQPATCVTLPLGQNQARYCAFASGMLATLDDSDVLIQAVTAPA